jgi:hypothetical protein
MDEKLKSTIDKVVKLANQNAEFGTDLRKKLGISSACVVNTTDERIDNIYEYCIEKVVRRQAEGFYADFPLHSISDTLIEDFCRMESFRRKDNFGDFCLSVYQQIEGITNKLCTSPALATIVEKMVGYPAYVKSEKGIESTIEDRTGEYTIAALLFPGQSKKTGLPNSIEKSKTALQSQYAIDKVRIIVYFLGYQGMMKNGDFESFREFTSVLSDIYSCRNTNHRGNTVTSWEQEILNRVISHKDIYYLKFLGALTTYIDCVKTGYPSIPRILEYAEKLESKTISYSGPKVVGKIDLPDDGKKKK